MVGMPIMVVIVVILLTMVTMAPMMIIDMYGVLPYMDSSEGDRPCSPSRL